jgi:hypothetical protein
MSRISLCLGTLLMLVATCDAAAQSGETGAVCLRNLFPSASCSANDIKVTKIVPLTVIESCAAGNLTTTAVFDVTLFAIQARSDIGVFFSLDGGNAIDSGICFHDYLQPPLVRPPTAITPYHGPWRDADLDSCGDMDFASEITKDLNPSAGLTIPCNDVDGDGMVDVAVCMGWSSATGNLCTSVHGAIPEGPTKCGCTRLNVGISAGAAGGVDGLVVGRAGGGTLAMSWGPSCIPSDTDYEIYEGDLGSFSSHHSVLCSTGGTRSASLPEPPSSEYYLVVPRNAAYEGSYGFATAGLRPVGVPACALQQYLFCGF